MPTDYETYTETTYGDPVGYGRRHPRRRFDWSRIFVWVVLPPLAWAGFILIVWSLAIVVRTALKAL